jgi:flagellar motor switch/type III secretory pathway protein FliN
MAYLQAFAFGAIVAHQMQFRAPMPTEIHPFEDLPLDLQFELDRLDLKLAEVLAFTEGHILSVSKPAGEPLDIYVGGVALGSGEVMPINETLGVRFTAYATGNKKLGTRPAKNLDLAALPEEFRNPDRLGRWLDETVSVSVVVGRAWLRLDKVLKLTIGSFVELEGGPRQTVEVVANDRVLAYGEVVVRDGCYGVRIQAVATHRERIAAANLPVFMREHMEMAFRYAR